MATRYFASIYHQVQPMAKRVLSRRGFTLIELLMTVTAAAIILLIMGKFLADFHASREVSKVMVEMQEQAQFAMDYMTYGFVDQDKSGSGDVRRKEGLIWASLCNIDSNKKLSFKDPDSAALIVYEEWNNQLVKHLSSNSPGDGKVIIPYLDGSQEYLKGPYEVSVKFMKDANQPDPDRSVSIDVTVSKDKLTSTLKSAVTLRNRSAR